MKPRCRRLLLPAALALASLSSVPRISAQSAANAPAGVKEGLARLAQGLNEQAMNLFEAVLQTDAHNEQARAGEIKAATAAALKAKRAGDEDGAMVYLVRARKHVPNDPALLLDFGVQADRLRLFKDGEAALQRSLELRPGDAETIYALGRLEFDAQKLPEAEARLREYLQLRPEDATAHYGLGKLLHMLSRDADAEAELRRSIELLPQQTESYYELGSIELDLRHDETAEKLFRKVLARDAKHGGALAGMGMIAFHAKDYHRAESFLKSAVLCAPDYSQAHVFYSMVLARLGRKDEAQKELELGSKLAEKQNRERSGYALSLPVAQPH